MLPQKKSGCHRTYLSPSRKQGSLSTDLLKSRVRSSKVREVSVARLSVYSWLIDSLGIKSTLKSMAIQAQALLLPLLVWLSEKMDNSADLNGT